MERAIGVEEFSRVLNIGLGRAALILQRYPAAPYRDAILYACLHNTACDPQLEGSRAEYLREIIRITGDDGWYRDRILRALDESVPGSDDWDTEQLFDLATLFARAGDTAAREIVYRKFLANIARGNQTGARQIVDIDGLDGLLFVAERLVIAKREIEGFWFDGYLMWLAEERFGEDEVRRTLERAAVENLQVEAYAREVRDIRSRAADYRKRKQQENPGYVQLRRLMRDSQTELWRLGITFVEQGRKKGIRLRWWGAEASEEDIRLAANDLIIEQNRDRLLSYIEIFHARPFPLAPDRLFDLAMSSDDSLSFAALRALENLRDDRVRSFALAHVRDALPPSGNRSALVDLLLNNYEEGDHLLIQELLQSEDDPEEFHSLAHSALRVFKKNMNRDVQDVLLLIYERDPCSSCREWSIDLLHSLDALPEWVSEECRHDSNPDIRAHVQQWGG